MPWDWRNDCEQRWLKGICLALQQFSCRLQFAYWYLKTQVKCSTTRACSVTCSEVEVPNLDRYINFWSEFVCFYRSRVWFWLSTQHLRVQDWFNNRVCSVRHALKLKYQFSTDNGWRILLAIVVVYLCS